MNDKKVVIDFYIYFGKWMKNCDEKWEKDFD